MEDKLYNELKSSNQSFQINNFKALYFHSPNKPKTTYSYNNIKITIANGMRINCFINEDEKWSKVITKKVFGGIGASGFGYQNPLISSDSKRILISFTDPKFFKKSEPSLLEIDLETGKILKSIKNASKYAYSGDSNFVLYFDTKRSNYSVYSIKEDSITEFYYFENCFWLVKD
jgi:effector-binding domain-containing protein